MAQQMYCVLYYQGTHRQYDMSQNLITSMDNICVDVLPIEWQRIHVENPQYKNLHSIYRSPTDQAFQYIEIRMYVVCCIVYNILCAGLRGDITPLTSFTSFTSFAAYICNSIPRPTIIPVYRDMTSCSL